MNKRIITLPTTLIILAVFLLSACATETTSTATVSTLVAAATSTQSTDSTQAAAGQAATVPSSGNPPSGTPPSSAPPGGNPTGGSAPSGGTNGTNSNQGLSSATGAYTLDGKTDTQSGQTYTASNQDQSAVYVINGGNLSLINATITTSANTSSTDNSSFYGLNAGVLATSGSMINMSDSTVSTTGKGANGVFATGTGSTVTLSNVKITATGDGGHGAMASNGGALNLTNDDITTSGTSSAPIATDRGGGTITVSGGTVTTSGMNSPCLYSTGNFTVTGLACSATGSESAVIEGANTITLTNSSLTSSIADKWGVMIYQSMSGDAQGAEGIFNMTGGTLANTATTGPLFFVTNTTAIITLKEVSVSSGSGVLVEAGGTAKWGTSGSNGGTVNLTADEQTLSGDMVADNISLITLSLQNGSLLDGAINSANTAKSVNLTLDASSSWNVTADSYLTCLIDTSGISETGVGNITGNGHTVYYNASACSALASQTYTLNGGGYLKPSN